MATLYQELVAAGCRTDSHESDLYVEASETAREIIKRHQKEGHPVKPTAFISNIDGRPWYDLPFCYDPWWDARNGSRQYKNVNQFAVQAYDTALGWVSFRYAMTLEEAEAAQRILLADETRWMAAGKKYDRKTRIVDLKK